MKINLPITVIIDCMENSLKFREHIAYMVTNTITKHEIENVFMHLVREDCKIDAIKALREYSRQNADRLFAIKTFYPKEFGAECDALTLVSSKSIIELYTNN